MMVRFLSAGDRALVIEFGECIDRALSGEVLRLDARLRSKALAGVVETVPTFRSLMVHYDPLGTTRAALDRRVAAGSIAIATTLTAIYPYESPGGWHLIGMTPIRLFDPQAAQPALLAPGDEVQCEPVEPAVFASIKKAVECGRHRVASEPIAY